MPQDQRCYVQCSVCKATLMVTQEKRIAFRQEVKDLPLQVLLEMKSKLDVYSRDKQTILLEEIESREEEQKQTYNKEVLETTPPP